MATETGYMQKDPLVTPTQVKNLAFSHVQNFDATYISSEDIKLAALKHLKEPLGHSFFYELVSEHHDGSLSTHNATLMSEYLELTLAYFVRYEKTTDIHYRQTNQGIVTTIDDLTSVVDKSEFNLIKEDVYQNCKLLLDDMIWFIEHKDNISKFPTYRSATKHTKGDSVEKVSGILFYDNLRTSPLSPLKGNINISKND